MSIRFPTDNDAGMSRPSAPRRQGGGGRLFFMLFIGLIAFMMFRGLTSQRPSAPTDANPSDRNGGVGSTNYPDLNDGFFVPPGSNADQQRVDNGDWGMEDGPVQRNAESKKPITKSSNGDWGMEDAGTQRDAQQPAGRFSQSSNAPVKEPEKKQPVTQGDWSMDSDIDTTPKSTEPKKSTNGDWGLEQVD